MPLLNHYTIPLINTLYNKINRAKAPFILPVMQGHFTFSNKNFYLQGYGSTGFIEHQVLIPNAAIKSYCSELIKLINKHSLPIGLTTVKKFTGKKRSLNYNGSGYSFALHVPNKKPYLKLLEHLDEINTDHLGITSLYKDARVPLSVIQKQYPSLDEFRNRLIKYDKRRIWTNIVAEKIAV